MTPVESEILMSSLDDLRAERDRLVEERIRLLKERKPTQPLVNIDFSVFGKMWDDIISITRNSDGWHFGLWFLFAAVTGTSCWAVIYSSIKFWGWMAR